MQMQTVEESRFENIPPRDDVVLQAYMALAHLSAQYPGFRDWYWNKVVPGLGDTRKLEVVKRDGRIVGLWIAKRTPEELKICTLWVMPSHRGTGLGVRMIMDALAWLGTTRPLVTVSQERHHDFVVIFRRLGFRAPKAVLGLYREGMTEYVYDQDPSRNWWDDPVAEA